MHPADPKLLRNVGRALAGGVQLADAVDRHRRLPAAIDPFGLRDLDSGLLPFPDELAFHLGHHAQHRNKGSSPWRPSSRIPHSTGAEAAYVAFDDGTRIPHVTDYEGLLRAVVQRHRELGLTQAATEHISGLQSGYVGKIECGVKRLGAMSLPSVLGALGLELAVVRTVPHAERQGRMPEAPPATRRFHRRSASEIQAAKAAAAI